MPLKKRISIVIPLYNEKDSLVELSQNIEYVFTGHGWEYECIFVDDGSLDSSFDVLKKIKNDNVKIIRFRKNQGKSAALAAGLKKAAFGIVATLDADLQDDPKEILKMAPKLNEGYDLVVGWRKERKDSQNKIRQSKLFNTIVSRLFNISLHDINCGLKVFRKSVGDTIDLYGELHRFIPILAVNAGFKVTEIPIVHHERKYGRSKFSNKRIINAFFDLLTTVFLDSFKNKPMHIFGPAGLILAILGFIILSYLSVLHFLGQSIGDRPLLLLGVLLVLFGLQLFSTGLVGELIANAYIKNSKYPISEILE